MKIRFALPLSLTALLLSACQSVQYYEGPPRPRAQTAEVFVATQEKLPVSVDIINGKAERYSYSKRIYLLPGAYTFDLSTARYQKIGSSDRQSYEGWFRLGITAKAGKTYTFQSTQQQAGLLSPDAQLCVYEEDQDSPKAKANWTNEFRSPGGDAVRLACAKVEIRAVR